MKTTHYKKMSPFICIFLLCFFCGTAEGAKKKDAKIKKETPAVPSSQISQGVIDTLAEGNLYESVLLLREKPSTPKSSYLLNAATNIILAEHENKRPSRSEWHQHYQNLAISYHNLFLFLKARDIEQPFFFKEAMDLYKKSKKNATSMHKQEVDILMAALYVANGDEGKGESIMEKFKKSQWSEYFPMQECIATYYAAKADVDETITALKKVYMEKPAAVLTWLAVTDDFYKIKGDSRFVSLLNQWHLDQAERSLKLSMPTIDQPKLIFAEQQQVQFKNPVAVKKHFLRSKTKKKSAVKTVKKTASKKASNSKKSR